MKCYDIAFAIAVYALNNNAEVGNCSGNQSVVTFLIMPVLKMERVVFLDAY